MDQEIMGKLDGKKKKHYDKFIEEFQYIGE